MCQGRLVRSGHELTASASAGRDRLEDRDLLDDAEKARFASEDKTISHEQNLAGRKIAPLNSRMTTWRTVEPYATAIEEIKPGEVKPVYCDTFSGPRSGHPSLTDWLLSPSVWLLNRRPRSCSTFRLDPRRSQWGIAQLFRSIMVRRNCPRDDV